MKNLSKLELRKTYRQIRAKIPAKYRQEAALAAASLATTAVFFLRSETVAVYLAFKDEFDSAPLIETIWQAKKSCYLPVLAEDGKSLQFVLYQYGDKLRLNRFSILEPVNTDDVISPNELDLVIMPLIAFDRKGNRLGTGGGYYDRTFAELRETNVEKHPYFAGLAFAAQEAETIPSDAWDIRMQSVITEKEIIHCQY